MKRKISIMLIILLIIGLSPINLFSITGDNGGVAFATDAKNISLLVKEDGAYKKSISMSAGESKSFLFFRKTDNTYTPYMQVSNFKMVGEMLVNGFSISSGTNGEITISVASDVPSGEYKISGQNKNDFPVGSSNVVIVNVTNVSKLSLDNDSQILSFDPGESRNVNILVDGYSFYVKDLINKGKIIVVDSEKKQVEGITLISANNTYTKISVDSSVSRGNIYYIIYDSESFNIEDGIKLSIKENNAKEKKIKSEYSKKVLDKPNVSSTKDGIKISWKGKFTNKPTGYQLASSTSKSSGYKTIYDGKNLSFQDKANIKKGKTYYYKVRAYYDLGSKKVYTKWSTVNFAKAKVTSTVSSYMENYLSTFNDHTLLDNAKVFTNKEVKWIDNVRSEEDLWNNVLYSYLIGNYELNFVFKTEDEAKKYKEILKRDLRYFIIANNDLVGAYTNAITEATINISKINGMWYQLSVNIDNPSLSIEEVFQREKDAFIKAKEIVELLHKQGKIKDTMSQNEKAKVYNDFLISYNVTVGIGGRSSNVDHLQCMPCDDAYATLVAKCADCGGRAAGFNLLMGIEGIKSVGLGVQGHIASLMTADGKELANDWGNRIMLTSLSELNKRFPEVTQSLNMSRKILNSK